MTVIGYELRGTYVW